MILDSTFLNDLVREHPVAVDFLEQLIGSKTPVAVSSLTVYEVGIGLRGESKQYQNQFDTMIEEMEVVPLGPSESRRAIQIQGSLKDRGEQIGAVDILIAATAAERPDSRVLTRNVDEFSRVDEISVETY
ncbi:type II toxin-antitoxin system VapC family toxin [Natronolimnobius sp. AArcel1]|uniref:PIN domain-containing protein n=1 Tax=Natronolimnobius sp. AArcel1 TaxID=1679093 RepID=UPI0013EA43EB|nr:PIN domain-containing protein [Natronolimnobius sp. AArcel1]NGM71449.1 type II toxin-antitoxin system VapC family toxin [Natronolimnobius sp. AArcel1]